MAFKKVSSGSGVTVSATQQSKTVINKTRVNFREVIFELIEAHHKSRKTMLIWGNSGYGKSATVKSFCKEMGFKLEQIFCITLDPLTQSMPVDRGGPSMVFIPNEQLERLCNATEPTVVLYDETNKFSNPSVENMLNSIFLDREYNGHKFSESVVIIGCMNFKSRSTTAQELDFSIINRATNILFRPSPDDIRKNMQTSVGGLLASILPVKCNGQKEFDEEVLSRFNQVELADEDKEGATARQMDEVGMLIEDNPTLSDKAIEMICNGRLGDVFGGIASQHIIKNKSVPKALTQNNLHEVVSLFHRGDINVVIALLKGCQDFDLCYKVAVSVKDKTISQALVGQFGRDKEVNGKPLYFDLMDQGIL
jgi:hypothetical protein